MLNTRSDYDFAGESVGEEKTEEKVAEAFMSSSRLAHGSASCFFISPPASLVFVNGSRLIR